MFNFARAQGVTCVVQVQLPRCYNVLQLSECIVLTIRATNPVTVIYMSYYVYVNMLGILAILYDVCHRPALQFCTRPVTGQRCNSVQETCYDFGDHFGGLTRIS